MTLGTTTWRKRNKEQLAEVRDFAKANGIYNPTIIEYGPGGAVSCLMDFLPEGNKKDWAFADKVQRGIVKLTESILRKTNLFLLETSEPEEVASMLKDLSPQKIEVIDKEMKVICAVQELIKRNGLHVPIGYHLLDIQKTQFYKRGDIVLAYNII